jgi:putative membrane protein
MFPLAGFWLFVNYLVVSLALFAAMVSVYVRVTPYAEVRLMRAGNTAAATGLAGAMIGLALPLASAVLHTVSMLEMVSWAVAAMAMQALAYHVADRVAPELRQGIEAGKVAHGVFRAGLSIAVGLINAACIS